jgi:tetratricopeptide (TPR) repeat protein
MSKPTPQSLTALTAVTGVAGVLFGIIVGYMVGVNQAPGVGAPIAAAAATAAPAGSVLNEQEAQAYRNVVASDPKNLRANVELANLLYDAGRYTESISYYQQAFALDPRNVNVSTDLGTALHYAGRADDALAQFERSLTIDPKHAQTLFNIGVAKRDGKNDPRGAIEAWQKLLVTNPDYVDAPKVRTMIADLQRQL